MNSLILLSSNGKLNNTLTFFDGNIISVKEVAIESGLEKPTQNLREAVFSINLISINPVKDVKESVQSKGCNVVWCDILNNSYLV